MSQDTVKRDRPWLMRTYSGHSSAKASNELYRMNLGKGQTGLSVAFDLPTQTGYDADHPLARGEVGKVGVPVCSIDDMETLRWYLKRRRQRKTFDPDQYSLELPGYESRRRRPR